MRTRSLRRLTAVAALALFPAVLLVVGAPVAAPAGAAAANPPAQLRLDLASRGMPAGATAGKVVQARYGVRFGPPLPEVTITVDATAAADSLRITVAQPTPGCAQDGAVLTCTLPMRYADFSRNVLPLRYTPTPTATAGTEVSFGWNITAPGAIEQGGMQFFTLTGPLPDFSGTSSHVEDFAPGRKVPVYPSFRNVGNAAASGLLLQISWPSSDASGRGYRNCFYEGFVTLCPFPGFRMEPGQQAAVSPSTPIVLDLAPSAPGLTTFSARYQVEPLPAGQPFDPGDAVRGTGPPLRLQRVATTLADYPAADSSDPDSPDADFLDSGGYFYLHTTVNPADVSAAAVTVRGRPGQTVALPAQMTNRGPADLTGPFGIDERWDGPTWPSLTIDVPPTVEVVQTSCFNYTGDVIGASEPGHRRYRCFFLDDVEPGTTVGVLMSVRILSANHSTATVTAAGGTHDPIPGNNAARLHVNP